MGKRIRLANESVSAKGARCRLAGDILVLKRVQDMNFHLLAQNDACKNHPPHRRNLLSCFRLQLSQTCCASLAATLSFRR